MKRKSFKEKYQKKVKKNHAKKMRKDSSWILIVTVSAFWISFGLSFLSELLIPNVGFIFLVLLTLLFIVIGIIFDMIGVAVTAGTESPLNAMSSKKLKGAKKAVSFKKNADKVSSFCNDVIGDICGIISGSAGVTITADISKTYNLDIFWVGLVITGIVASLTIGGKALCKSIAMKNSKEIVYFTAKIISIFERKKK